MKYTLFLLFAVITTLGCKNNTPAISNATTIDTAVVVHAIDHSREQFVLDSTVRQYRTTAQYFKASVVNPTKIIGVKGTLINIDPADLETVSGKQLGNHIDIELKELTTSEELAREGLSTVTNGKFQISGGAYYINMTSGGEQLKCKTGRTLAVKFRRNVTDEMALFIGQSDSTGQVTWKDGQQAMDTVEMIPDPADQSKKETKHTSIGDLYDYVLLSQFGWVNCSGYYSGGVTSLSVDVDKADSVNCINAYLVFKDINSVLRCNADLSKQPCSFNNIPIGAKAALVIIASKNGKTLTSRSKIVTTEFRKVPVKLKETPDNEVPGMFKLN